MSNTKILIVDDNGIYAEELKIHLQNLGYQTVGIVPTGEKAISKFEHNKIDLILMDIKLRGALSGIETANQIRLKYDTPVVYLTAFSDQETIELAKKTEPYGFLCKPTEEIELQRTIELALYKHGMENKLKKSEQRFKQISSSAYDGIILINEEGVINFWNEAAEKIFGYSAKEALNKNLYSLIAPRKYLKEYKKTFKDFVSAKNDIDRGKTIELIANKKDSTEIYIELSLSGFKEKDGYNAIAIIRDINEKKKTKEEQILLSTAIEQADESVLITDAQGLIQYVNPAFENISGYTRQEVIGKNPNISKSGKQDEGFYQKLWHTISRGKVWKGRLINRQKDGSLYSEEATISPVRNNFGKIINFVAVKRDITTNLILEKKIRQTQNLQIMGLYANLFVHDFNNLLQPILLESNLLLENVPEENDIFSRIKLINNSANKAKDMAKQILIFSRKETSIKKTLQIQTLIDDFFKIIKTIKPPGVTIQLEIDPNCDPVLANPSQINQLLLNLCTNAYHAMAEKGGVLTLSLKKITIDSATAKKFNTLHQGSYVRLSVGDNGQGIERKIVDKIFEPSFSTKDAGEGFGLGLTSVHNIVKNHDGEIVVDSKFGKGTTFHIYFPITKKITKKPTHKAEKINGGNENILLVDDEQSMAEMLSISLQRLGYNVTALTSSLKALEKFQYSPNNYDIVITDQTMPGLSGDLLAIELLKIRPGIPIVLCTGFSERVNKEKAIELGIKAFLLKPFTRLQLCQTIRNILDGNK